METFFQWVGSALRGTGSGIRDSYRLGAKTFVAGPAVVALVILPEFAQHVVEITIGMFDSRSAAHALAQSPLRWDFGYVKLTGLALTMLFTARFWAKGRSVRRAILVPPRTLAWVVIGIAALVGGGAAFYGVAGHLPKLANWGVRVLSGIFQAGLIVWLVGKLIEDSEITLRQAFTTRLPTALVITILLAAAFVPGQWLHGLNHKIAVGEPRPVVWTLMTFDALVVGLMAAVVGSGLYVGYQLDATWRGWKSVSIAAPEAIGVNQPILP